MRLLASATALILAGVATVVVGIDQRQPEAPAKPLPPRVVFTLPTCDGIPAYLNVTNAAGSSSHLRVGFNDDVPSLIEPGGSVGFELTSGAVQVVVNGAPYGKPFQYLPPSCLQLP